MDYFKQCLLNVLVLLIFSTLIGCGSSGGNVQSNLSSEKDLASLQEVRRRNAKLVTYGGGSPASPADYFIGPGDLLDIQVFEVEDLSSSVRVSSRGMISIPLLGVVEVGGMTAREAEEKMEKALADKGYLVNPSVSIFIEEHRSKQIAIVGFVQQPGNYEMIGRMSILEAIAKAGGFAAGAGRSVYITRSDLDGSRHSFIIDLDELLVKGNVDLNIDLRPGDVVYLAEAGNVYIEGAVRKTGTYSIKEGSTTLSQAIATAGGPLSYADKGDLKLIRYLGNGKRDIFQLDLNKIQSGEQDDPILKDGDALIVGSSGFKKFVYSLGLNLGFGLLGVSYKAPQN